MVNGSAGASYPLPAGTPAGTYVIQAVYNGTVDFGGSSDTSQNLIIKAAVSARASASVTFTTGGQSVPLTATITVRPGRSKAQQYHQKNLWSGSHSEVRQGERTKDREADRIDLETGFFDQRSWGSRRGIRALWRREFLTAWLSPSSRGDGRMAISAAATGSTIRTNNVATDLSGHTRDRGVQHVPHRPKG